MAENTKERILDAALELFSKQGYLGTSMSDIAEQLGITKAALYKHYAGKQALLDRIIERMNEMDCARAREFKMPQVESKNFAEEYLRLPAEKIRRYTAAQFDHWTKESFSANFRKMLTLEQYRAPEMARLYQNCLVAGPVKYMAEIFRGLTDTDEAAIQLALEFYGPIYLLYGLYDDAEKKESVTAMLNAHVERFIARIEFDYRKAECGDGHHGDLRDRTQGQIQHL